MARLTLRKRLAFSGLTLALLFGVPEAFLQVREVVRARRKPRLPTQHDPWRGIVLVPGARYARPEQNRAMEINSLGMRSPELGPRRAGVPRLLCVGGSTTFGLYASSNETTWPQRLRQLQAARGREVEVANAGAPGWSLRASLNNLELRGFGIEPDVVVCYHAYNDLMSNGEEQYWRDSEVDDVQRLYRPQQFPLLEYSATYRLVRSRLRDPYDKFLDKADLLHEEGVAAFERNLRRLVRRCAEQRARLLLCTFPTCFRETEEASRRDGVPELDQWYGAMCPMTYPRLVEGLRRYNEVVRQVGRETTTPVADLERTFPRDVGLYRTPLHHNDAGDELVAKLVSEALEREGLLPAR